MITRKLLAAAIGVAALTQPVAGFADSAMTASAKEATTGASSSAKNGNNNKDQYKQYVKSLPAGHQQLLTSYETYFETTVEMFRSLSTSPAFLSNPTGLLDMMSGMTIVNLSNSASSHAGGYRGRPVFNHFDNPMTRIGIDNPDSHYLSALIPNTDGQQIFRVSANRGTTADNLMQVFNGSDADGGGSTIEAKNIVNLDGYPVEKGDDYEVYLSTAELYDPNYMYNWMEIKQSSGTALQTRWTACDYGSETPGDVSIERVGTEGVILTDAEFRTTEGMVKGWDKATETMTNQTPFWGEFSEFIKSMVPANFIPPYAPTGAMGITSQFSSTAWFDIEDDEALVISYRNDLPGSYASIMFFNAWGSSLPWGHAPINANFKCGSDDSHAAPTEDGLTHIVVTNGTDPGVRNWVTTMGHDEVFVANRLQGLSDEDREMLSDDQYKYAFMPQVKRIKLSELEATLPADMEYIDSEERAELTETRQDFQKRKYAPW